MELLLSRMETNFNKIDRASWNTSHAMIGKQLQNVKKQFEQIKAKIAGNHPELLVDIKVEESESADDPSQVSYLNSNVLFLF